MLPENLRQMVLAAGMCALAALPVGPAHAADDIEPAAEELMEDSVPIEMPKISRPNGSGKRPTTGDGYGAIGRAGHLALSTFGRNDSISTLEGLPYWLQEDHFFFGDMRGFVSNNGLFGGNAGLGYRYVPESSPAWYGASLWYDADDTTGKYFQQLGLSLEAIANYVEARSNLYFPVGATQQNFGSGTDSSRFSGNQLLFGSFSNLGQAMSGVDYELGVNLPVTFWHDDDRLRGYVGGYNFTGSNVNSVSGFKLRTELVVNNTVSAHLMYTNDPLFGSNIMVGMMLQFPYGRKHPTFGWKRNAPSPFRFVERNYNVIVAKNSSSLSDLAAFNPATGLPYQIEHVAANGSAGGNGTVESPFATVAQAQAAGGDLVFVHADSNLHESIALKSGQRLIGEASGQTLAVQGHGSINLPHATGTAPIISQITGTAITLADRAQVSGFTLQNIFGDGIVGNNVAGVGVHNVSFKNVTGDALRLSGSTGTTQLQNLSFDTIGGRGLVIDGGAADIAIAGTLHSIAGDALVIQNTTGGTVALDQMTIDHSSARGLVVSNFGGTLTAQDLTVNSSGGDAIFVSGGAGTISFPGLTKVDHPQGRGLAIGNTDAKVTVSDLTVTSTSNAAAIDVSHTTREVVLSNITLNTTVGPGLTADTAELLTIPTGSITAAGAAAVDVKDSALSVTLTSVSANGGAVGIRIVDSTGGFATAGDKTAAFATGGLIQNTTTAVLLQNAGTIALSHMDLTGNVNGVTSSGTAFLQLTSFRVQNTQHYALDSLNDKIVGVGSSLFSQNGAIGEGTFRVRDNTFGTYQVTFLNNTITDDNGVALAFSNSAAAKSSALTLNLQSNAIASNRDGNAAVLVNWNGPLGLNVINNTFNLNGASMVGVDWQSTSTTDQVNALVTNNTMTFASSSGIGIRGVAAATSSLQYGTNKITFNGASGTGMDFTLNGAADVWLYSNLITDNAAGATGMLFHTVGAGSRVQVEGNTINLLSTTAIVDQGIIFVTVNPTVGLLGNTNNLINGATTAFSVPSGTTNGSILVNGFAVP